MLGVLSYLNKADPVVRCKIFFAIRALWILLNECYNLSLLYFCMFIDAANELYFDANTFGMRFRPYKFCTFDLWLSQPFDFFQQSSKQLRTLSFAVDPRRTFVTVAVSTESLILASLEERLVVNRSQSTSRTYVWAFWDELESAERTKNGWFGLSHWSLLNKHANQRIIINLLNYIYNFIWSLVSSRLWSTKSVFESVANSSCPFL